MLISEAIAQCVALTGQVVANAVLVRWLSEIDGRLAFEFYRTDAWTPYDPTDDINSELLVPFPWDGFYVQHLAAQTYFSNGEYDRYENERVMSEKTLGDFRHFMQRTQALPCRPGFPTEKSGGSYVTVITPQETGPWFWISAYALAVKHGFTGTEDEWLDSLGGLPGEPGVSPEVTVASITGGHSVTITDADHPSGQTFNVMDGEDGADGQNGADGVSPGVTITDITGGHTVTITDKDHPSGQSFSVMDGTDGADGEPGPNTVTSSTATSITGVLTGDGSNVGSKALDTSSLTNDNDHIPTSGVVKSAITNVESDLAGQHLTGSTNTTGATIADGTYFYLDGALVRAKADIASGATFTAGTNYETVTAGGLNELKSAIDSFCEVTALLTFLTENVTISAHSQYNYLIDYNTSKTPTSKSYVCTLANTDGLPVGVINVYCYYSGHYKRIVGRLFNTTDSAVTIATTAKMSFGIVI